MEQSPCQFDDGAAKDMERWYLKEKEQGDVDSAQNPSLDEHVLLSPPTSEPICTRGAYEHLIVGRFYEIDHSKLPPKYPDHLKFIRVVMLSDMGELQVSLRYPSIHSLRTQLSDTNYGKPDKKGIPALDEKYVMGSEFASNALYRRVPTEEYAERRNSWSFWIAPSEENERDKSPVLFTDKAMDLVSKKGSCWSQLKFTGMMQWGKRRPVRFLGRHDKNKLESLSGYVKETGVDVREQNEREEGTERKRKKGDDEEPKKEVSCEVRTTTRKSKRNQNEISGVQKSKKAQHVKQNQLAVYNKKKRKISIDRWSAERYKLAEENMLKVMKAKGAVFGKPILRPALRSEARKLIGDTGLLDHLLKHMAGKVAPGGTERFRRRHNAEGAMEYWLESADLINIRREAGVQDPYWTPPPGWKPGDNPSQDPICARALRDIKEEMSKLKHDMQQLLSKKREEELAIVTTANSCLSNNLNLDNEGSLVIVQEMYKDLVNKKSKIEEQLKGISLALSDLEEHLVMLKPRGEEPTSESVTPPALLPGPTTVQVAAGIGGETKEEEHKNKETTKSGEERSDEDNIQRRPESRTAAEDKAAKIERLKSGFRICKPQGTFLWPKMAIMSPQDVVQLDDHIVVPTPSSASSSSTTSAPKPIVPEPPQSQHVPNPPSPVKPLAERRPVSTATLTHVTMSFSPYLSPPPTGTPGSKITATENPPLSSLINLNEAPPCCDSSSFCGTLTYQPSLAPTKPHCPTAGKVEATEKECVEIKHYELQKEKENSSSSSSPQLPERNDWWRLAMAGGFLSEASQHII